MNLSDWITIVCSVIEAAGVFAALAWSVHQFRQETEKAKQDRLEERYARIREEALLVNALTTVCDERFSSIGGNHRCRAILLRNGSSGPLSNVRIQVRWDSDFKEGRTYTAVPGEREDRHYDVVSEGTWIIAENEGANYSWNLPVRDDGRMPNTPLFILEGDKAAGIHKVLSMTFFDAYGNMWCRVYEKEGQLGVGLHLAHSFDKDLRQFVSPFFYAGRAYDLTAGDQ